MSLSTQMTRPLEIGRFSRVFRDHPIESSRIPQVGVNLQQSCHDINYNIHG